MGIRPTEKSKFHPNQTCTVWSNIVYVHFTYQIWCVTWIAQWSWPCYHGQMANMKLKSAHCAVLGNVVYVGPYMHCIMVLVMVFPPNRQYTIKICMCHWWVPLQAILGDLRVGFNWNSFFFARICCHSFSGFIHQSMKEVGWKPVKSEKDPRQETLTRWGCYSQENLGLNIELSYIWEWSMRSS